MKTVVVNLECEGDWIEKLLGEAKHMSGCFCEGDPRTG
jgi:hypothetical protein